MRVRLTLSVSGGSGEPSIGIPQTMEPKAPDQPAVTVVEISDPAMAGQGIELVDLDCVGPPR